MILKNMQTFPYEVGEKFKRSEMHQLIGGSFRHGMTKCNGGNDFLLFQDAKNSRKFGYDKWEGAQVDGSFHYTGQGTIGNQELTRANASLMKASESNIPIHLIESEAGTCTYLGQYILGEPPFTIERAPDANAEYERDVFVFKLVPVSNYLDLDLVLHSIGNIVGETKPWVAPNFDAIHQEGKVLKVRQIDRAENKLQADFGNYLIAKGHQVFLHEFSVKGLKGQLKPDFWIPCLGFVVEAKPSNAREFIRLAIGQVLDYVNLSQIEGKPMLPAILVPNRPAPDLCQLIGRLGITLITKNRNQGFDFKSP